MRLRLSSISPGALLLTALLAQLGPVTGPGCAVETAATAAAGEPVALVTWVSGEAFAAAGDGALEPLALFARLEAGSELRTGADGRVVVVFFDGRRFELDAGSRVQLEAGGARAEEGRVRALEAVPAVARLPRLARSDEPGKRPGASRIRDGTTAAGAAFALYPRDEAAVAAGSAALRFSQVPGTERYRVEVTSTAGNEVFAADLAAADFDGGEANGALELALPGDALEAGEVYYWRVVRIEKGRQSALGGAIFATLGNDAAGARAALAHQAAAGAPADLRLLLAEVDQRLGLWREACRTLAGVSAETGELSVGRRLEELGCGRWSL